MVCIHQLISRQLIGAYYFGIRNVSSTAKDGYIDAREKGSKIYSVRHLRQMGINKILKLLIKKKIPLSLVKIKSNKINIINGGRYDNLIGDLGSNKKIPAVGAAINLND